MKRLQIIFLLLFWAGASISFAQSNTELDFARRSYTLNNAGMYVLGSWALLNLGTGAAGWAKYDGEKKYFNQMNFFWNTVNLTIAGVALYNNYQTGYSLLSPQEALSKHLDTEKILLINAGLDAVYISTGFLLKYLGNKAETRKDLLRGYGNSLLLQGAFLLLFDAVLYGLMHQQSTAFTASTFSPELLKFSFRF